MFRDNGVIKRGRKIMRSYIVDGGIARCRIAGKR
jgi:hypothetical protein